MGWAGGGRGLHELTPRWLLGLPTLPASGDESSADGWGPPCHCALGSGQGSQALQPSRSLAFSLVLGTSRLPLLHEGGSYPPRKRPGSRGTLPGPSPRADRGICIPSCPRGIWLSSRAGPGIVGPLIPLLPRMGEFNEKATCGTVCLKYLLFTFNCCFWVRSAPTPVLPSLPSLLWEGAWQGLRWNQCALPTAGWTRRHGSGHLDPGPQE